MKLGCTAAVVLVKPVVALAAVSAVEVSTMPSVNGGVAVLVRSEEELPALMAGP